MTLNNLAGIGKLEAHETDTKQVAQLLESCRRLVHVPESDAVQKRMMVMA